MTENITKNVVLRRKMRRSVFVKKNNNIAKRIIMKKEKKNKGLYSGTREHAHMHIVVLSTKYKYL